MDVKAFLSSLVLVLVIAASPLTSSAQLIDDTFTYQGVLEDAGQPANGAYDLQFQLSTPCPGALRRAR
ncbi:MAG: hypothetical protein AAF297_06755 [Planctomycetota bacterium]